MAELATNISAKQQSTNPRQTALVPRFYQGSIGRFIKPVATIAAAAQANDTIFLGYMEPGEFLLMDLCNITSPDVDADSTGNYVFDIGFQAADGGASALDSAGNAVTNDPDLFVDGATVGGGGKVELSTIPLAYHRTPTIFRERVGIWATLISETTPDADVPIQFNLYLGN